MLKLPHRDLTKDTISTPVSYTHLHSGKAIFLLGQHCHANEGLIDREIESFQLRGRVKNVDAMTQFGNFVVQVSFSLEIRAANSSRYPRISLFAYADVTFIPYSPFGSLQIFSADNIRPCRTLPLAHTQQQSRRRTKQLPQQAEWKRIARNS